MKPYKILFVSTLIAISTVGISNAQPATDANNHSQQSMMHDETGHPCTLMEDSMMGDSMTMESSMLSTTKKLLHDATIKMFILPSQHEELQLSEEQISRLLKRKQDAVDEYFKADVAYSDLTDELETLATKPDVTADILEAGLLRIAKLQIRQKVDMFAAAAQMSSILSPDQIELFESANPKKLHQQMMSSMSMPEMMEMMKIISWEQMDNEYFEMSNNEPTRQVIMGMMPGWMKMGQDKSVPSCCELQNTLSPDASIN